MIQKDGLVKKSFREGRRTLTPRSFKADLALSPLKVRRMTQKA